MLGFQNFLDSRNFILQKSEPDHTFTPVTVSYECDRSPPPEEPKPSSLHENISLIEVSRGGNSNVPSVPHFTRTPSEVYPTQLTKPSISNDGITVTSLNFLSCFAVIGSLR